MLPWLSSPVRWYPNPPLASLVAKMSGLPFPPVACLEVLPVPTSPGVFGVLSEVGAFVDLVRAHGYMESFREAPASAAPVFLLFA